MYLWSFCSHLFSCQHCLQLKAGNPENSGTPEEQHCHCFSHLHFSQSTSNSTSAIRNFPVSSSCNHLLIHQWCKPKVFTCGRFSEVFSWTNVQKGFSCLDVSIYCHFRLLWGLGGADQHGTAPERVSLLSGSQAGYVKAPPNPLDNCVMDLNPTWVPTIV